MRQALFASLALLLVIFTAGCFNTSPTSMDTSMTEPDQTEPVIDLDASTGGFTEADEEPAFGEPENFELQANETSVTDPYGETARFREMCRLRKTKMYRLRAVWGHDGNDNEARELLKVHIRQIRRRLSLDPERQHYIRSVRGFGYMLTSPEDD